MWYLTMIQTRMKCFCLFLFIFFTKANVGNSQGKNCSPKDGYPCKMYTFSGNNCSASFLKNQIVFPADIFESKMNMYPGRPGSVRITINYKLWDKRYVPEVNLLFTLPSDVNRNLIKGFEVSRRNIFTTQSTETMMCYIYVLSNVTWKGSSDEITMTFNLSLFPVKPETRTMYFEVYSLPKYVGRERSTDFYQWTAVEIPPFSDSGYNREVHASNWRAAIFWTKLENEGHIFVSISPPPPRFGLIKMEYSIVNDTSKLFVAMNETSINETNFTFNNVVSGNYSIMVKPLGPSTPNCVCNVRCGQCITTPTSVFSFRVPTLESPSATTTRSTIFHNRSVTGDLSSNESYLSVILPILAVSCTLVIIVGLFVFWYIRRWHRSKEKEIKSSQESNGSDNHNFCLEYEEVSISNKLENNNVAKLFNNKPNKLQFEKRPKLFLLYEDDHEYHRKVVDKFASCLQQYCQCDVMCAEWQLGDCWVYRDLQQADYIVIVNSEGAYHTYLSQSRKLNMGNNQSMLCAKTQSILSTICMKNKFLSKDRYDNIVMIYFEYTDEMFVLPEVCSGYKYQIPKHFTDFLLHIHKLHHADNLAQYDLPLDENYCLKPISQELFDALGQALRYQLDNPHWSVKRFTFDRLWSNCSDDSQHDSGFPKEFISLSQTSPSVSKNVNVANIMGKTKDYLDTTSQGAITINPSDITYSFHLVPEEQTKLHKQRPILSAACFNQQSIILSDAHSPTSCDINQCQFEFIPPDDIDDIDIISKSPSDQMKSLLDRYQTYLHLEVAPGQQNEISPTKGYNRNEDLLLLKVQSGDVPLASTDIASLGGESV